MLFLLPEAWKTDVFVMKTSVLFAEEGLNEIMVATSF